MTAQAVDGTSFSSLDGFCDWAQQQEGHYELVDGCVVELMTGASPRHNLLAGGVFAALFAALREGPCRVYSAGQLLRTAETSGRSPDVLVCCADVPQDRWESDADYVVEVLSPSTERADLREKLREYRRLPSIRQYLVLDQLDRRAQLFTRTELGWHETEVAGTLEFAGCRLDLEAIYDLVEVKLSRNMSATENG